MLRSLKVTTHSWQLNGPFRSAYGRLDSVDSVRVELVEGDKVGRGECRPFHPYGQETARVLSEIEAVRDAVLGGMSIASLQNTLSAGSARNALDCAMWDLKAKQSKQPVWRLAGLLAPRALPPTLTIPAIAPEEAGEIAAGLATLYDVPFMKVKMPGDADIERIVAIHRNAPHARIIVDPNCSWSERDYEQNVPVLARNGVVLIEQPFPPSEDARLDSLSRPIPLCADESCTTTASLGTLQGRYDCISIKLEKTGGFTEALAILRIARQMGFQVMMSSMISPSLALAPAALLAGEADYPSLALPVMVQNDPAPGFMEQDGTFLPPPRTMWG